MMDNCELKYWNSAYALQADNKKYPSITLSKDGYYGLVCKITPDGNMQFLTHSGGGHGEPSHDDPGRNAEDWVNLISEASKIAKYYWS